MSDASRAYDYVFGFGSIMDTSTHATWQTSSAPMRGAVATISKRFGYQREWNFRSNTGFTALGVSKADSSQDRESCDINGVLFQVPLGEMGNFDKREVGYERVAIPLDMIALHPEISGFHQQTQFSLTKSDRIWIYVPLSSHAMYADENHPLLQSYVDTVLRGCLEWGGEAMAETFILTTGGWGTYFLNDTPSSRRPWLYRKEYRTIDELLKKYSEKTHYGDRRHPEEFAANFNQRMKGTWSIPPRNPNFTGRDTELTRLHSRFLAQDLGRKAVIKVEVTGMGGVGKSQLVTEFVYRHFPVEYGFVVWVNAETSDTLVADYRQLLADLASDNTDAKMQVVDINKSSEDVVSEVKSRLFRCSLPWLLVMDNLEDHGLLDTFVPHGAVTRGHILITTRHVDVDSGSGNLELSCFNTDESLEFLRRSVGTYNIEGPENEGAAKELSDRLGNLPLALGMAAAYMRRCDVQVSEYLERFLISEKSGHFILHGKLNDYAVTVASSLCLSLEEVEKLSPVACEVLKLLCFLGPDQISKSLIRHLLSAKKNLDHERLNRKLIAKNKRVSLQRHCFLFCVVIAGGAATLLTKRHSLKMGMLAFSTMTASMAVFAAFQNSTNTMFDVTESTSFRNVSATTFSSYEYEQSDVAWNVLKSFSLLTVKDGKGSVHRLLQKAMRSCQNEMETIYNLTICIDTMSAMWSFKTQDTDTWKDSLLMLEHVKSAVSHCLDYPLDATHTMQAGHLSNSAAIYSAMTLNAFSDAKLSLDLSLKLYENAKSTLQLQKARADALHELGRIFRYQGKYSDSKASLLEALKILRLLDQKDTNVQQGIADTLHELGLLELKRHNLQEAESRLIESLQLRRKSPPRSENDVNAECAATLHQLAAVHVAQKPPLLDKAKALLLEALGLCSQIGQRAATLKQLARVTLRQGYLDHAESFLEQALELYRELYADGTKHMNIAAVKFQQGALALQRERFDDAWSHFSECLRIRRHVYAYARSPKDENPIHLEVSCVLHELGSVAFVQGRFTQSNEMFCAEREILKRLEEAIGFSDRIHKARLTNLTWLRKVRK
ncbi:hypothetical protein HJC23_007890 [Cyclotella cryptica]|uniref:NB-ARC domain-containing protein n=1 Tax=Cyclotella cryptica TaxID=29204 RepID=A0ABD3R014_9STRA